MKLPDLNKREQFLIFITITLAFGFLLYRLLISPGVERVQTARFYLNSQWEIQGVKSAEIQSRGGLDGRLRRLGTAISETREILFSKDEAVDFLRSLPQLIKGTEAVLVTMKPGEMQDPFPDSAGRSRGSRRKKQSSETEVKKPCMRMPVQIDIRGGYSEIINLFEQLEGHGKLVTVSEIDLETAADSPAEVDATLMLNLYVHKYQGI